MPDSNLPIASRIPCHAPLQPLPRDADPAAFRTAASPPPSRASLDRAPPGSGTRAFATMPASRLTGANNDGAPIRHAPGRPRGSHIGSLHASLRLGRAGPETRLADARATSLGRSASVGGGDSGRHGMSHGGPHGAGRSSAESLASSGYHSASNVTFSSCDSQGSLAGSPSVAAASLCEFDEAMESLTHAMHGFASAAPRASGHARADRPAALLSAQETPAVSGAPQASPVAGVRAAGMPAAPEVGKWLSATPPLARSPAVRIATDALLIECALPEHGGTAGARGAMDDASLHDAPAAPDGGDLLRLGGDLYAAVFGQGADWAERAAWAMVRAAATLASGADKDDIDIAFVQLGLGHAIDNAVRPDASPAGQGEVVVPSDPVAAQLEMLDAVRQLRGWGTPRREQLEQALHDILQEAGTPRLRRITESIADVVVEMADEAYKRRLIATLLAAGDGNDAAAMHAAFQQLYRLDRASASHYEPGVERCLAFIGTLPQPLQASFVDALVPAGNRGNDPTAAQGLRAYAGLMRADQPPFDELSAALRYDQRKVMTDMMAAAATLRGDQSNVVPLADAVAPAPKAGAPGVAPPARLAPLRTIVQAVRRYFRPTALDRAQKKIAQALKRQASSAARDADPTAAYELAAQAYVATLPRKERLALHRMTTPYGFLKIDAGERSRMVAIHTALERDRKLHEAFIPSVVNFLDALSADNSDDFVDALDQLTYEINLTSGAAEARDLCEAAARHRAVRDMLAGHRHARDTAARHERNIEAVLLARGHGDARSETMRLLPALRAMMAVLE
ncbi:hypothetical protein ACL598_10200 [Bordetella bronchialis]|uniref:hypothetical protein n=1 Tax=Bordetella bronchialis TaxID=463025 RepID=UPI003CFBD73C